MKNHLLESDGTGAALFDFDGDGDLDLYLVSAWKIEGRTVAVRGKNALYRNDGGFRFTDVTEAAGVGDDRWGCGVAVGDFDNDGHLDLYVTNYGPNVLYKNRGDGTFEDVTERAGVGDPRWSSCATFFDADGDGDLDLYVTNYVRATWDEIINAEPTLEWKGIMVMVGPVGLPGDKDIYYRNRGDGTFEDWTKEAGLEDVGAFFGYTATATDYDDDGDVDLYVANDSNPNFCYRNDGNGVFTDVGGWNGSALSGNGDAQAGMGVDAGDVNGDLLMDLVVANFAEDVVTVYLNEGGGFFMDATSLAGIAGPTFQPLTWGVDLFDFDNDADLDLVIANGHIYPQADQLADRYGGFGFHAKNQLFENSGKGRLTEITDRAGRGFEIARASHGIATGDIDDDGDLDLVFVNVDTTPTILRNDGGNHRPWLLVDLRAPAGPNMVMNAKVFVTAGGVTQMREIRTGNSYASHNDLRAHFGLGSAEVASEVRIRWADGTEKKLTNIDARQILVVRP
ncbi:MAG: CRTAC1 family protein [Planctomycetota bacterium]